MSNPGKRSGPRGTVRGSGGGCRARAVPQREQKSRARPRVPAGSFRLLWESAPPRRGCTAPNRDPRPRIAASGAGPFGGGGLA